MLSRVADSLYWMSRYLERAEHTVRILDVNMGLMLDRSNTSAERRWKRVLIALSNPVNAQWEGDYNGLVSTLTYDANCGGSITSCIVNARENARQVRDEISTEQWQHLNSLFHHVTQRAPLDGVLGAPEFMLAVMDGVHLLQGATDSTMSHHEGWHFIQLGRYIERAAATANLLLIYHLEILGLEEDVNDGQQYLEWIGLLRSCTAFEAYCQAYTAELTQDRILEFLLLNQRFPHSLLYSIDSLCQALVAIQQSTGRRAVEELNRVAGRLQASLHFAEISEILHQDTAAYLQNILQQCRQIHDLIYTFYIHYSVESALSM